MITLAVHGTREAIDRLGDAGSPDWWTVHA